MSRFSEFSVKSFFFKKKTEIFAIALNFLKKLDSIHCWLFHVPYFCLIWKLSHTLEWVVQCVRLHGRKHKCAFCWMKDHWTWLLSDIVDWHSFWHGTHYLFSDKDAVTATFHVLVNTYFLNFRLALLIVLRALVHIIYLVIFNNFLIFNFPSLNFEQ